MTMTFVHFGIWNGIHEYTHIHTMKISNVILPESSHAFVSKLRFKYWERIILHRYKHIYGIW